MVGMVVVALFLQAGILMYVNSKNADKTSQMLLDQAISIIEKNQENEKDLIKSMKEDYIVRARAVAREIVPTNEYTPENRTGFLYIKENEKAHGFFCCPEALAIHRKLRGSMFLGIFAA